MWLSGPAPRSHKKCAEIIARHPRQVWGDLSYFTEVLANGTSHTGAVEALRSLASHPAAPNLLYGSDWIMVGQEDGADSYATRAVSAVAEAGLPVEDFAWRAAARFLGLDRPGKPRDRLLAFHVGDPEALAALRLFMPGLPHTT
ncbi:hypothetical protein [Belnapia moabensis]|uniref:hypothetical protein n=1 Tax=Belnapia moabensis TaxID=365533 RepID=UPI0005BAA2FA|nr:hypothetical protein [Belnapia moabensis]